MGALQLFFSVIPLCHALSYHPTSGALWLNTGSSSVIFFRYKCRTEEYICVYNLVGARETARIEIALKW